MKLSVLLAQYLYQHKQLHLPGIGIFTYDDVISLQEADSKTTHDFTQQIQFTQKQVLRPEDALIDFIRVKTGKIKALAEADLDSYLTDGKTLLNIGKPFHIEGVGSLHKTRQGQYEFNPGAPAIERMNPYPPGHHAKGHTSESHQPKKKSVFEEQVKHAGSNRMLVVVAMIAAALIVVIWGGYTLYNSHDSSNSPVTQHAGAPGDSATVLAPDPAANENASSAANTKPKGAIPAATAQSVAPGSYKFVIETTNSKRRALYRYNLLKSYMLDIRMDTKDSSFFKLYFVFPAIPADTIHIKDSLQRMYASKEIIIER